MVEGPRFLAKKSALPPCKVSFPTRMSPERTDCIWIPAAAAAGIFAWNGMVTENLHILLEMNLYSV